MILNIADIASRLAPDTVGDAATLSCICIRTTNPKYLLFRPGSDFPICVAQSGSPRDLTRTDSVLERIHARDPGLVARPLGVLPMDAGLCVHLQSGMPGFPWFVIQDRVHSREQWLRVVTLAQDALHRLRQAIGAYDDWQVRLNPAEELRKQSRLCAQRGELSAHALQVIEQQALALEALGDISSSLQHGDFCLNNLLIGDERAAVIDFDEFGLTAMPLHDEIGLALSVSELSPHGELLPLPRHEQLRGLYLHHLLWRINQANSWPTRRKLRMDLLARVSALVDSPAAEPSL